MKYFHKIHFLLILLLPLIGIADEKAETMLSRLQKKFDSMKDLSVVFTQTIQPGSTMKEQKISGSVVMKKGNKFRLELSSQTVVSNGATMWTYTKATNQVLIDSYDEDAQGFTPDKIFTAFPKQHKIEIAGTEKLGTIETTIVRLTPIAKRSSISEMKIWVDAKEEILKKIEMKHVSGGMTIYNIENMKFNAGVPDKQFQFEPPKGAEVIDMR